MTLNRLITTLVQLALAIPAIYMLRYVIADVRQSIKERSK